MLRAGPFGVGRCPGGRDGLHGNAVDGAGRQAQLTARAALGQDTVAVAHGANDGVNGAGEDALGAADAGRLVDAYGQALVDGLAVGGRVDNGLAGQCGQRHDGLQTTGCATVDGSSAGGDGLRVGQAARMAAALTLRLRQQPVYRFSACGRGACRHRQ